MTTPAILLFPSLSAADATQCTTVYVANLPRSADAPRVREMFSAVGKVLHVKLLRDAVTGVSRGVGFVMFEDLETAQNACAAKHRSCVEGHVLQVRIAERSAMHATVEVHIRSTTVFLRNVPGSVTKDDVSSYCGAKFGRVEEVLVHPQSSVVNGPSLCNAMFVTFESVDAACRCTEEADGKQPFASSDAGAAPQPLITAKMVSDVAAEMRKTIVTRATPSASCTKHNHNHSGSSSSSSSSGEENQSIVAPPPPVAPEANAVQYLQPVYQQPMPQMLPHMSPVMMPMGPYPGSFHHPMMLAGGMVPMMQMDPNQTPAMMQPVVMPVLGSQYPQPILSYPGPQQVMWVPMQNTSPPCGFQTPILFSGNGYASWN